jgi:hypothetical protein
MSRLWPPRDRSHHARRQSDPSMFKLRSAIVTAHQGIDRDVKYRFRGERFHTLLRQVGLTNLREAAQFFGLSTRHLQRIAAGTHPTSTAVGKLLALMHDTETAAGEF